VNTAKSGSLKRIGKLMLLGPLLGGLPFNLLIFTIPFAYAFGLIHAFLTGISTEIWIAHRQNKGRPIGKVPLIVAGCVVGFSACLVSSLIFMLKIHDINWNIYESIASDGGPMRAALVFSAMGGFWSAVLLPILYRSFVLPKQKVLTQKAILQIKDYSSAAPV
jgi:hypothetical protein